MTFVTDSTCIPRMCCCSTCANLFIAAAVAILYSLAAAFFFVIIFRGFLLAAACTCRLVLSSSRLPFHPSCVRGLADHSSFCYSLSLSLSRLSFLFPSLLHLSLSFFPALTLPFFLFKTYFYLLSFGPARDCIF